ncbi:MAG: LLM class flavin-dependent oxidoreductase [Chloroflexota bacterium]|jgi:alkanesulfonate monooxygenase SsuD/methylene tetrahydromethanopterin reductase-like flavin-dependent oxidoreductase (luciferase family)
MTRARIGVQVAATTPPAELTGIVAEVERLGYGEIWLAEDYFQLGGIASATAALGATQDIPVGLGVLSARVRHPAVTAMELATVSSLHPERFMAGLGHGVPSWVGQMGLQPASLIRSLREATSSIRRLLDGEELTETGEYHSFDAVRLLHPPAEHVPIYFGVHGPRSLVLSGELADGTLLGWFSSPDYVRWARERIDEGRAKAGRADHHAIVALLVCSLDDDDPDAARAELAAWATESLAAQSGLPATRATEAGRVLDAALQARDPEALLPDAVIGEFMAAGSVADCARFVDRLLGAGADRVVLVPNPAGQRSTDAMVEQIRRGASLLG